MWDDDDLEYARNQLLALGKAVHSHCCVYVDFPSQIQAAALTELVTQLTRRVTFFEEERKDREHEEVQ